MRDYLRFQPDNFKSVNLVKEVISYLGVIYSQINKESIELVTQTLDTLNEFSMGNLENQHLLFDSGGTVLSLRETCSTPTLQPLFSISVGHH